MSVDGCHYAASALRLLLRGVMVYERAVHTRRGARV